MCGTHGFHSLYFSNDPASLNSSYSSHLSCIPRSLSLNTSFQSLSSLCSYFAVVVFKFLILMLEEVGGDEAFLRRAGRHKLKISTGPCCCCCVCLPYVAISR